MPVDLEEMPDLASQLCREAHQRLWDTVSSLSGDRVRTSSRLGGWTVGHVLTHLARNADAHARVLRGALVGEDRPKYSGGHQQRSREIDQGAARRAEEILHDLGTSQASLEAVFEECSAAGWPNPQFFGGRSYGPRGCPAHRLRETEMHHVDLRLGYEPSDWSDEYVAWELPVLLSTVDERLESPEQRRSVAAWLAGRGTLPDEVSLAPWG
jgi:maleylpyruvate isomerase